MDEIACAASGRATPRAMGCGVKAAPFMGAPILDPSSSARPIHHRRGTVHHSARRGAFDAGAAWPFEWPLAAGVGFRTPLSPKGSKEDSAAAPAPATRPWRRRRRRTAPRACRARTRHIGGRGGRGLEGREAIWKLPWARRAAAR